MRQGRLKWVLGQSGVPDALYDLAVDPGENDPLRDQAHLAEGFRLRAAYERRGQEIRDALAPGRSTPIEVDASTRRKLDALGYTDIAARPPGRPQTSGQGPQPRQ